MAFDSTKPVTGGSLVAADVRENFRALKEDDIVEGVAANGIVEGMIGAGAVVEAKLGAGAVTEAKLGAGAVTEAKLGAAAVTEAKLGASAVALSKLKTSTQSQSYDIPAGTSHSFGLTGGQYIFYPTIKAESNDVWWGLEQIIGTTYVSLVYFKNKHGSDNKYAYVLHRYITSSGEVNWLFILREKETKKIIGRSIAPDHPCFGNGGKPLLTPHPFGNYDETKHEIIVINPTNAEIEQMELETIVEDETKPDKDLIEVIAENYEIDEGSNPVWSSIPITVGLPKHIVDKKTGKKILADYRFMPAGTVIEPIKKIIPKPDYILVRSLRKKAK